MINYPIIKCPICSSITKLTDKIINQVKNTYTLVYKCEKCKNTQSYELANEDAK
jgi:uncharacterized Zn finger protein